MLGPTYLIWQVHLRGLLGRAAPRPLRRRLRRSAQGGTRPLPRVGHAPLLAARVWPPLRECHPLCLRARAVAPPRGFRGAALGEPGGRIATAVCPPHAQHGARGGRRHRASKIPAGLARVVGLRQGPRPPFRQLVRQGSRLGPLHRLPVLRRPAQPEAGEFDGQRGRLRVARVCRPAPKELEVPARVGVLPRWRAWRPRRA